MKRIDEIKKRLNRATKGEWTNTNYSVLVVGSGGCVGYPPSDGTIASLYDGEYIANKNAESDAEFIANSKLDIGYLIGVIEELEQKIEDMEYDAKEEYPE